MDNHKTTLILFVLLSLFPIHSHALEELFLGGNPLSIDVSTDKKFAVIALHSPPTAESPNLIIVNLESNEIIRSFRIRLRMSKVAFIKINASYTSNPGSELDGLAVAALFGDQGSLTIINPHNGAIIKDISTSPRPSNIKIVGQRAYITGSNTGDINVIDLPNLNYLYSSPRLGVDPRDFEVVRHSASIEYAYVSLGGEKSIAVIEISTFAFQMPRWKILNKIEVGYEPSSLELNEDKTVLAVTNLGGNSVNLFNITTQSKPVAIKNSEQKYSWPVGQFPGDIAHSSDPNIFYVANSNSHWITAIDIAAKQVKTLQFKDNPNLSYSALAAFDGKILATEAGPNSNLTFGSVAELTVSELDEFDLPGEPSLSQFLPVDDALSCPGFYFSEVTQQLYGKGGSWGKELLLKGSNRTFQGGMILKSNFNANEGAPGYGGFNITNGRNEKQTINIKLTQINAYNSDDPMVEMTLRNSQGEDILGPISGSTGLQLIGELDPGFYYFRVKSLPGAPAGEFIADIATGYTNRPGGGFQGGLILGGYFSPHALKPSQKAFGAFCIKEEQNIEVKTFAGPTYGANAADNIILSLSDRSRIQIASEVNTPEPSQPVEIPVPLQYSMDEFDLINPAKVYIDANYQGPERGTVNQPYKSITKAITKTNRSNVIYFVRPGTYSRSNTNEKFPIGSRNPNVNPVKSNVWILGEDPESTIIDTEFTLRFDGSRVTAVQISSVQNVRFSGFTIKNSLSAGIFVNNSDNVRIDHNQLIGNSRFGLGAQSVNRLMVDHNLVIANSESGIVASSSYPSNNLGVIKTPNACPESFGVCIVNNTANGQRADGILVSQGGQYFIAQNTANENGISGIEINNRYTGQGSRPELTGDILNNRLSYNGGAQLSSVGTGVLVTEFAHAKSISGNTVNHNFPGGIAIFEDSLTDQISDNMVADNTGNGIAIQKRSAVMKILSNQVLNNGLSGIFLASEVTVDQVNSNVSNFNGQCIECLDAKNGLAILGNAQVRQVNDNEINNNASGVQVANNSSISEMNNNNISANINIGLFVRNNSIIDQASNITMNNNKGIHSIFVSNGSLKITDSTLNNNEGEGLTISEAGLVAASYLSISEQFGEGIYLRSGGTLDIQNSTIENGRSWGISATGENTSVDLTGSIVQKNKSGIIAQNGAVIQCIDSIVAENNETQISGSTAGCN